ncbi:MAG: hypothetical protein IKY66_10060 [Bacteroidales bacterium]|nr:hypothetical protein [Bacteroidales bacterium]
MKLNLIVLTAFALFVHALSCVSASAQQPNAPSVEQRAEEEANRLQRVLDLDDWQAFYVDSTLKHDLAAIMTEYEKLQSSRVNNMSLYQSVQDKWMEQIDATYKKIFTEEQWAAYLKTGAAKTIKAREKRKAKSQGK